ncbi:ankyrin repeat-containing domain protein [Chaetomium sp. MPI-SDFR-AT-0129]|nr:ankyrin repeat-containing domain protein [Chaetomium sp. MPI-SDFR-AT-0129]
MEASVPAKDGTPTSLWEAAFDALSAEDKEVLEFSRTDLRLQELVEVVEQKKQECVKKQWTLYKNKAGEKVLVRDVLAKVVDWIEKFKEVGDMAVQFDPGHATIPWAAVKMLLQATVNDTQTFGTMAESLERISSIVARYTDVETRVLIRTSVLTNQLSTALMKLYGSALRFLAHACRYYAQSTLKRTLKSIGRTAKMTVEEPMLRIEQDEDAVYKLVSLVQSEIVGVQLDDVLRDIKQSIKQSVESLHVSDEERSKRLSLSAWINGVDTKNTYETALQYRHEGTCEWVLRLDKFRLWKSGQSSDPKLLWIHGPPGFGKTFMSARVIQHLSQGKQAPLSYFFCVADSQATRDPYAILRSWLTQMLGQDQSIVSVMDSVHKARNREQTLTHSGLWQLFVAVGSAVDGCTFVVDGFDECVDIDTGARYHHDDPRNLFLRELVLNLARTKSRVLVVSRDVPDIREYLGEDASAGAESCVGKLEYGITAKHTTADVESFSEHMVDAKLPKKKAELRREIAAQAANRSGGMFLWIKLLEQAISPGQNAKQLVKTVTEMPSGIDEAYSRELEKIARLPPDEKDQAVMILRWTLFAVEALQVKQLAEALVVSGDELEEYPDDELPDCWRDGFVDEDYVNEMILGRCGSLLQLQSTSTDQPLADHTVHFVHFSAKEYLSKLPRSTVISNQWVEDLGLGEPAIEEARLSSICLRYLTLNPFKDILPDAHVYPFLSYAAWAWYFHSFREKPTPSQVIMHRTQRVFDPITSRWRVWMPLMEAKLARLELDGWRFGEVATMEADKLIYCASLLGLTDVVRWLEDQGLDCSCVGGYFGFPLQAAVVSGQEDLVRYLLDRGVNVCQTGGYYGAAVVAAAAARRASSSTVQMLLEAGADPKAADGDGSTALHYAARRGDLAKVRYFVERGADVNAGLAAMPPSTPLYEACHQGHDRVVSFLIDHGANLQGESGAAVLEHAILSRHPAIVKLLLARGADPNIVTKLGVEPLSWAAALGDIASIEALVDSGAYVGGITPSAIQKGKTPLQMAIRSGQLEAAKALYARGADLSPAAHGDPTALHIAVQTGFHEAVTWLLEEGASIRGIWNKGRRTAFDLAVEGRDHKMAELLIQLGCFRIAGDNGKGGEGSSAPVKTYAGDGLVALAYGGDLEGVKTLLSGQTRSQHVLGEAMNAAAARGHVRVVDLLLRHGVRGDLQDINGRTALHHAVQHLHFEVADLLLEHGAGTEIEDISESTPFDLALQRGKAAAGFIRDHMDSFTAAINRQSSLLTAVTPNHAANLTVMDVSRAITGNWEGRYWDVSWSEGTSCSLYIYIPPEAPEGFEPSMWYSTVDFHGYGVLYRGQVDAEKGTLNGTWGVNRKLLSGTFELRRKG